MMRRLGGHAAQSCSQISMVPHKHAPPHQAPEHISNIPCAGHGRVLWRHCRCAQRPASETSVPTRGRRTARCRPRAASGVEAGSAPASARPPGERCSGPCPAGASPGATAAAADQGHHDYRRRSINQRPGALHNAVRDGKGLSGCPVVAVAAFGGDSAPATASKPRRGLADTHAPNVKARMSRFTGHTAGT